MALFRIADVTRAADAAKKAGLPVFGVEVTRAGTIRILTEKPDAPKDDVEKWFENDAG